jgi:hypothetical protein
MKRRLITVRTALLATICVALLAIGGCTNIRDGQDPVAVNAEKSVQAAFEAVDSFLTLEDQNRSYVKEKLPAVHAVAEQLRGDDTKNSFRLAWSAVRAYELNPSPQTQSDFETKLARVQALARTAREALAQLKPLVKGATDGNHRIDQPAAGRSGNWAGGDSEIDRRRQAGWRFERRAGRGVHFAHGEGVCLVGVAA